MLKSYISIARPDHWFKNIFMLPGFALAIYFHETTLGLGEISNMVMAVVAACLIASANYTINEWLDAETDRHHPIKKHRPSVAGLVNRHGVILQWLLLTIAGLAIGWYINLLYFSFAVLFVIMGLCYNVPPLRTKEIPYFDVLTESINNPIRLLLGWSALMHSTLPPSSIILAYWMGGAFLMAIKRYGEYRYINDHQQASLYRASFAHYTADSLLLSGFCYALISTLMLGVFLIKYRVEYILSFPFIAILFVYYFSLALKDDPVVQAPERLYTEKGFLAYSLFLVLLMTALSLIDIDVLDILLTPIHIES
jgi:4-hydroxybenzoate polyprenyltransferase